MSLPGISDLMELLILTERQGRGRGGVPLVGFYSSPANITKDENCLNNLG